MRKDMTGIQWIDSFFNSHNYDDDVEDEIKSPVGQLEIAPRITMGEAIGVPLPLFIWENNRWNMKLDKEVFKEISPYTEPMKIITIIGPKGSGKTTLLNHLIEIQSNEHPNAFPSQLPTEGVWSSEYLLQSGECIRILDVEGWDNAGFTKTKHQMDKIRSLMAVLYCLSSLIIMLPGYQNEIDDWDIAIQLFQHVGKGITEFTTKDTVDFNVRNFPELLILSESTAFDFQGETHQSDIDLKMKEHIWKIFPVRKHQKKLPTFLIDEPSIEYLDEVQQLRDYIVKNAPLKRINGCHLYEEVFLHMSAQLISHLPDPLDMEVAYKNSINRTLQHHTEMLCEMHKNEINNLSRNLPLNEDEVKETINHLKKRYDHDFRMRVFTSHSAEVNNIYYSSLEAMLLHQEDELPLQNIKVAERDCLAVWNSLSKRTIPTDLNQVSSQNYLEAVENCYKQYLKTAKGPNWVIEKVGAVQRGQLLMITLEQILDLNLQRNDDQNRLRTKAAAALFGQTLKGLLTMSLKAWNDFVKEEKVERHARNKKRKEQDKLMYAFRKMCMQDDFNILRNTFWDWKNWIKDKGRREQAENQEQINKKLMGRVAMQMMGQSDSSLQRMAFQGWQQAVQDEKAERIKRSIKDTKKELLLKCALSDENAILSALIREWRRFALDEKLKRARLMTQWTTEGPQLANQQIDLLQAKIKHLEGQPRQGACCVIS